MKLKADREQFGRHAAKKSELKRGREQFGRRTARKTALKLGRERFDQVAEKNSELKSGTRYKANISVEGKKISRNFYDFGRSSRSPERSRRMIPCMKHERRAEPE